MHEVALVHLTKPGATVKGCGDLGVAEIDPGIIDSRLIRFDQSLELRHQGTLCMRLLLCARVRNDKTLIAIKVELRVRELRLILRKFRCGLIELRLVGSRIDLRQYISTRHVLAFSE